MKNKKLVLVLTALTAGSIIQAHTYYDENGYKRRDGLGAIFAAPFDIAAAPFDEGNYANREYNSNYDTRIDQSSEKRRDHRRYDRRDDRRDHRRYEDRDSRNDKRQDDRHDRRSRRYDRMKQKDRE